MIFLSPNPTNGLCFVLLQPFRTKLCTYTHEVTNWDAMGIKNRQQLKTIYNDTDSDLNAILADAILADPKFDDPQYLLNCLKKCTFVLQYNDKHEVVGVVRIKGDKVSGPKFAFGFGGDDRRDQILGVTYKYGRRKFYLQSSVHGKDADCVPLPFQPMLNNTDLEAELAKDGIVLDQTDIPFRGEKLLLDACKDLLPQLIKVINNKLNQKAQYNGMNFGAILMG